MQEVLAHYEAQTDDDAIVEDEVMANSSETMMTVPHDLVPVVRALVAKRHSR